MRADRELAARWTSPMSEQGFCLRDPKGTFGCMTPHTAPQRTLVLVRRLDPQSFAGLLRMLKIHDHFDWKVRAELAAEAPGQLERSCPGAREFFIPAPSQRLRTAGGCRIEKRPGAREQVQNRRLDSSSSALAAIWLDLSKGLLSPPGCALWP